ncbi:hypothetical protein [Leifsonia sp. NPDC077715]|uniref:hypothetical protein n=1 Tax=Leifsonia sp. NPDC077715 TaxID=3155539 RepID=UPI00342B6583
MMLPPTPRVLFLRELVAAIRRKAPAGRAVIAVDGGRLDGGFADDLADVFREAGSDTFRASISNFHSSRAYRTRLGRETPESYYRDAYDYVTLRRVLLDPFRLGGSTGFQLAAFDAVRDQPVEARWLTAGMDAVLVLDGEFLLRPSLRAEWTASIRLVNAPPNDLYIEDAHPASHADHLVDDSEPSRPVWAERG